MNEKEMVSLPIGIQSFEKLRSDNSLYVDKTQIIHLIAANAGYYFLSRPRRFGKSLLLSTLKELFSANRALFDGLWIADKWNWEEKHPVIHISFSSIGYKTQGLETAIARELDKIAATYEVTLSEKNYDQKFKELIQGLAKTNKVVILIDEYDKPIIDYLTDIPQAKAHQNVLKSFYSVIKDSDPYIRFLFITGVSKFSKVSIFSELNNLYDITLKKNYAALTGYTQSELEHYFEPYIQKYTTAATRSAYLEKIKTWYNGYSWDGATFVYNPFSILGFFLSDQFHNFWFNTGTPTFLIKLMKERQLVEIENVEVGELVFESYDIENLESIALLFQTGYLTIKSVDEFGIYTLAYPNQEVKAAMLQHLIGAFSHSSGLTSKPTVVKLRHAFVANDIAQVVKIINSLFKSIPSTIFIKSKEAYYHSVVFLVFQYLGQFIDAEINTSDGRIDAVVQTETVIYVIEFKLDQSAKAAIQQIEKKAYSEKYAASEKSIMALGINFSSASKSIDDWQLTEIA